MNIRTINVIPTTLSLVFTILTLVLVASCTRGLFSGQSMGFPDDMCSTSDRYTGDCN